MLLLLYGSQERESALHRSDSERLQALRFPLFGQQASDPVRIRYSEYLMPDDGMNVKKPIFRASLLDDGCASGGRSASAGASGAGASGAGASGAGVSGAGASGGTSDAVGASVVVKFVPTGRRPYGTEAHKVWHDSQLDCWEGAWREARNGGRKGGGGV